MAELLKVCTAVVKMGRNTGKVRLRGVKGKRWKKGQSSSSNPLTKKHRLAAKGKFGNHLAQVNPIPNGRPKVELTTDALASHNAYQGDEDIELARQVLLKARSNVYQ